MRDWFSLEGRIALVTGGSGGIGRMICAALVGSGARVYVNGRSADACEAAAVALRSDGGDARALPGDVTAASDRSALADALGRAESRLDILVNNAGVGRVTPFGAVSETEWDETLAINLKAPFFLTQTLLPLLARAAGDGPPAKVVNIASIDGLGVNAAESYAYQASKAALVQLTRRLAARLIGDGVLVTCVAPGAFPSDMNVTARDRPHVLAALTPAGRVGDARDIGAAVVYLASRAGDYVAGETLVVDGGWLSASPTHGTMVTREGR
jgi:NAD(P)-dependent dehydrogenase (short-subunit alcohol dehydrogenase family)